MSLVDFLPDSENSVIEFPLPFYTAVAEILIGNLFLNCIETQRENWYNYYMISGQSEWELELTTLFTQGSALNS